MKFSGLEHMALLAGVAWHSQGGANLDWSEEEIERAWVTERSTSQFWTPLHQAHVLDEEEWASLYQSFRKGLLTGDSDG